MSIGKYLDVSTCHVTQRDMDMLIAAATSSTSYLPVIAEYREGIIAYAEPETDYRQMRREGISESFIKLHRYAVAHDCYLVRLDCDADIVEGLDTHDW